MMKEKEMLDRKRLAKMVVYMMRKMDIKPPTSLVNIAKFHGYERNADITSKELESQLNNLCLSCDEEILFEDNLSMNWIADWYYDNFKKNQRKFFTAKADKTQIALLKRFFARRSVTMTKKMVKEKNVKCYLYDMDKKKYALSGIFFPNNEVVRKVSLHTLMILALEVNKKGGLYVRTKRGDNYGYVACGKKPPDEDYMLVKRVIFGDGKQVF